MATKKETEEYKRAIPKRKKLNWRHTDSTLRRKRIHFGKKKSSKSPRGKKSLGTHKRLLIGKFPFTVTSIFTQSSYQRKRSPKKQELNKTSQIEFGGCPPKDNKKSDGF